MLMHAALALALAGKPDPTCYHDADRLHIGTRALIVIDIDKSGKVVKSAVFQSSGYDEFDAAALAAADASTFSPKVVDCSPVASRYIVVADFDSHAGAPTVMPVPAFTPPPDWHSFAPEAHVFDRIESVGNLVGAWQCGDERLQIAEYVTPDASLSLDRAFELRRKTERGGVRASIHTAEIERFARRRIRHGEERHDLHDRIHRAAGAVRSRKGSIARRLLYPNASRTFESRQ